MDGAPSEDELEAAYCWETSDRVPGRPEMTAFRRQIRLHQARWREGQGHPVGSQPIRPLPDGPPARPVGSRLPLDYARSTGANFLTANALDAASARLAAKEPHQMFDTQRLWADLLSSPSMCFNLFGDLTADHDLADRAIQTWWPDAPGSVNELRFAHSPGRLDATYLGNLCALDVAVVLGLDDGTQGLIGIATKYHDRTYRQPPKPSRLARYIDITKTSGIFVPGAIDAVNGTDLIHIWLDHLLVLSMLQHPSGDWTWGRHVVVHPAGNTDHVEACARYRELLTDQATFASASVEDLLDADILPASTTAALRLRYLPEAP